MKMSSIAVLLCIITCASAQTSQEKWTLANGAMADADVTRALTLYGELEQEGLKSTELYHNMGLAWFRLDSIALSILYFERAIKFDASNREAARNLQLVQLSRPEPIVAIQRFFLLRWARAFAALLSPLGWGIVTIVLLWALAYVTVRRLRGQSVHRAMQSVTMVAFICSLSGGVLANYQFNNSDYGVVMQNETSMIAPDPLSEKVRQIPAGEKVKILDSLDGFVKVRYVNFEYGWLPASAVRRI